jgi:CRP-like cAMP-binding protein
MSNRTEIIYQNFLLQALAPDDRALLSPHLERVPLALRQSLERANQPFDFVYFPEDGLGSVVAKAREGTVLEVGLFGRDGMTGSGLLQGDDQSPFDCYAQMEGSAMRISVQYLTDALTSSPSLTLLLTRYARSLSLQTGFTALANVQSKFDERLARWLLMVHDRAERDSFAVTHEFLAVMLGVHRPGVTVALQILEGEHLIKSIRGKISIVDRDGLIAFTRGAYGAAEVEYTRLTGIALSRQKPVMRDLLAI